MEIVQSYPARDGSDSGESTSRLPDASAAEVTMKMKGLNLKNRPEHIRKFQGTGGQSSGNVQAEALVKLGNMPDGFFI